MGLPFLTLIQTFLLFAICKATKTYTITPLRSLEGPGGAFDVPKDKCPPDGGSPDCVTGNSTQSLTFRSSSLESAYSFERANTISPIFSYSPSSVTSATLAQPIYKRSELDVSTPPLTPDFDNEGVGYNHSYTSDLNDKDAFDFLMTLFPHHGLAALPFSKRVQVSSPDLGATFEGVVLQMPNQSKTLYINGKSAENVGLRESIVAILDLADEALQCEGLVIILEKSSPNLKEVIHSLMYVGGAVVTQPVFPLGPAFVLLGLSI